MKTDAASAACQLSESARTTAAGRLVGPVDGNTACATPAASAVGSAPPTRVVFFVANVGKPRSPAACGSSPATPETGAVTVFVGGGSGPVVSLPHPEATAATAPASRRALK